MIFYDININTTILFFSKTFRKKYHGLTMVLPSYNGDALTMTYPFFRTNKPKTSAGNGTSTGTTPAPSGPTINTLIGGGSMSKGEEDEAEGLALLIPDIQNTGENLVNHQFMILSWNSDFDRFT